MEEEVRGELDPTQDWKASLLKKRRRKVLIEVVPIVILGALLVWFFIFLFTREIDRFTYGPQAPKEATSEYVKDRFADLILEPSDGFELRFYHPTLRVWSFYYRPQSAVTMAPLIERAVSNGWQVTMSKPLEIRLEKRTTNTDRLIARVYLRKSMNKFDIWVTHAKAGESANQRWTRIDVQLGVSSQPRSTR